MTNCFFFQMSSASSSIESDFDDRFLRCFGLGESEGLNKGQANSQSDREDKLRIQAEESPWWVYSCVHDQKHEKSRSA